MEPLVIERLAKKHGRDQFDCGVETLNRWLRETAGQHVAKGLSQTYVAVSQKDPGIIVGFYALTLAETDPSGIPEEIRKRYPRGGRIPAVRLGRLAVSRLFQRQGVGELLLMDAIARTQRVVKEAGGIGLFVDALDESAAAFYRKYGFVPLPSDPLKLFLPVGRFRLS